ncbi:MAG TPA: DMT family transporter [Burkholderiaceae bacterium]|nr:DMT family transporter [Burkholderiaceae bacterium]
MRTTDLAELLTLAALWGASFLFMRVAAPEFGPVALTALRVGGAALFLLPLLAWHRQVGVLRQHWRPIAVVGLVNSALPFVLFSVAALAIDTGLSAIFNATAPLWGAVVAWAWLGERPGRSRVAGLALGFAGVVWLAWDKASVKPGAHGVSAAVAIGACLLASAFYGFAANYTRRRLAGVAPLAVAAGSQTAATLLLALPASWVAPAAMPGARAWASVALLALLCTGVAYLLYFRLIAHLGAARAITVTYLIPLFAALWGALLLGETLTPSTAAGCLVILAGTALATGFIALPGRPSGENP